MKKLFTLSLFSITLLLNACKKEAIAVPEKDLTGYFVGSYIGTFQGINECLGEHLFLNTVHITIAKHHGNVVTVRMDSVPKITQYIKPLILTSYEIFGTVKSETEIEFDPYYYAKIDLKTNDILNLSYQSIYISTLYTKKVLVK